LKVAKQFPVAEEDFDSEYGFWVMNNERVFTNGFINNKLMSFWLKLEFKGFKG
jgi:hypothetical protein